MSSSYKNPSLVNFQSIFEKIVDVPYFTGAVPLNAHQSSLFYRCENENRLVDFANPTEAQLKALADACAPATFGRNQEDLLDESYRKAGKMDVANFSAQFSPWDSGIIHTAVDTLFKSSGSAANVAVELYKLNVYGPGSFFKAHVDTPRSDKMFGSLVVVLPTPHTGGSLLFRHQGKEYTFDSAKAVTNDAPHVAFAAFFSDVEHEVAEVTSGYRVTLTYNLYHSVSGSSDSIRIQNDKEIELSLQDALASLLSTPNFLQDGGLLAFDLSYEYPRSGSLTKLSQIGKHLKGVDALLKRVCDALKLDASVKALYRDSLNDDIYCFVDRFVVFGGGYIEDGLLPYLCQVAKAPTIGYDARSGSKALKEIKHYGLRGNVKVLSVVWAKPPGKKNSFEEQYISYGNEANMSCAYGKVCLVVPVKPAHERG